MGYLDPILAIPPGVAVNNRPLVSSVRPYREDDTTPASQRDPDAHIVVMLQTANWNNQELLATPVDSRFCCVSAVGYRGIYSTVEHGYGENRTDLCNRVENKLYSLNDTASWTKGAKPVSFFLQGTRPVSWIYDRTRNGQTVDGQNQNSAIWWAGVTNTAVLLRFDLFGLPLAKATSFSAYLRAYCPSGIATDGAIDNGILYNVNGTWGGAAMPPLDIRFFETMPSPADAVAPYPVCNEQKAVNGTLNNGSTAATFSRDDYTALTYDPFGISDYAFSVNMFLNSAAAVFANKQTDGSWSEYYYDYELTGACKDFLKTPRGSFWATVRFPTANWGWNATTRQAANGLMFIHRIALRLRVTMSQYNNTDS